MSRPHREAVLEESYRSYQKFKSVKAWYSAASYLAEISHAIAELPVAQRAVWNSRIEKEELPEESVQQVRRGLKKRIEHTHRILSVGTEWTGEEILLVMTLRIEIKLVSDFLGIDIAGESLSQIKEIDDQLATLEKSKNHSRHFKWGLRQMKKHGPYDVEPVWRSLIPADQS